MVEEVHMVVQEAKVTGSAQIGGDYNYYVVSSRVLVAAGCTLIDFLVFNQNRDVSSKWKGYRSSRLKFSYSVRYSRSELSLDCSAGLSTKVFGK